MKLFELNNGDFINLERIEVIYRQKNRWIVSFSSDENTVEIDEDDLERILILNK